MKHSHFAFLLVLLLTACQTQPTVTPVPPVNTPVIVKPQATSVSKSTPTAVLTSTPTGPVVHSSSSDSNASDLIVVKDQFIANDSLMIDAITAAQAGYIVLYFDKQGKSGGIQFGSQVISARIPAGKTTNMVIPLGQNLNPSVNPTNLPGTQMDAVLQSNPSNSNTMVHDNGKLVWVRFTILTGNGVCKFCAFLTTTP